MKLSEEEWQLLEQLYPLWLEEPSSQFGMGRDVPREDRAQGCAVARRLLDKGLVEGGVTADNTNYNVRLSTSGGDLMRELQTRGKAEVVAGGLLICLSGAPRSHHFRGQDLVPMVSTNLRMEEGDEDLPLVINDAVAMLKELGVVSVQEALGTGPFAFAYISANHKTHEAANNYRSTRRIVGGGRASLPAIQSIGSQLNVNGTGHQFAGNIMSPGAQVGDVFQERAAQLGEVPPQLRDLSSVLDNISSTLETQHEQLMEIGESQLGTHELLTGLFKRLAELDDDLLEIAKSSPDGELQALAKVEEFIDKVDLEQSMSLFRKLLDEHGAPTLRTLLIAVLVKYGLPAAPLLL